MSLVSIIISSRNETYLAQTAADLLAHATGDIEILVGFDGPSYSETPNDARVRRFELAHQGLYPTINHLAAQARGEWLFKVDAHCSFSLGYDVVLSSAMQPNWLMMPRFYVLHPETWEHQDARFYDYFKLCCPLTDKKGYRFQAAGHWPERTAERLHIGPIDDTMQMHGSAWMVQRDFFLNEIGGMDSVGYGNMFMEPPQLCLKYWLGPWNGRCVVNKNAFYAHAHKGAERPRGYGISMREVRRSYLWTAEHWMRNQWPQAVKPLSWLVDKFAPVPTWPSNWQDLQRQYEQAHPEAVAA